MQEICLGSVDLLYMCHSIIFNKQYAFYPPIALWYAIITNFGQQKHFIGLAEDTW